MIYLVGNKADFEQEREVSHEKAIEWACQINLHKCFETSAKTGKSVEEVFSCAGKDIFAKIMREMKNNSGVPTTKGTTPTSRRSSVKQLGSDGGVQKKDGCC